MKYTAAFFNRTFTAPREMPGRREQYRVTRFSVMAVGGADAATIEFRGSQSELLNLFDKLASGIRILDQRGRVCWIGLVTTITATIDQIQIGLTTDGMANRVAALYNAGAKTEYTDDLHSQSVYGIRERLESVSLDEVPALRLRDVLLERIGYPISSIGSGGGEQLATITCKGLWYTLDWRYYAKDALSYDNSNNPDREYLRFAGSSYAFQSMGGGSIKCVGYDPDHPEHGYIYVDSAHLSFHFKSPFAEDCYINGVKLWFTTGPRTHANTMYLRLFDGWVTHPAGNAEWVGYPTTFAQFWEVPFSTPWLLGNGANVTMELGVTSAWAEMPFEFRANVGNRPAGWYTTASQSAEYVTWDELWPLIQLTGYTDYSVQIAQVIAAYATAGFIAGSDIQITSGILQTTAQDGTQSGMAVLGDMLKAGTGNNRRMIARVTSDRILEVREEPLQVAEVFMQPDGRLRNRHNQFDHDCPVGKWVQVVGLPAAHNALPNPLMYFCENAELDCETGIWSPQSRDAADAWSTGGLTYS